MSYPVVIRAMTTTDEPLVYDSWIGVCWNEQRWRRKEGSPGMGKDSFCAGMHARIERLLERSDGYVATVPKDPDTVCGYLVREAAAPVLHFVYVREPYRSKGHQPPWHVATQLMRAAFGAGFPGCSIWYSHHTGAMRHLAPRWRATFNPFLVE